jgi:predicted NBD/HSP70 family sugar kinase
MDRKVDSRAMREVNRSIIFDLIRQGGKISRTDLARRSALTKPTVSAIVEELLDAGVVREVGFTKSEPTGGRRARLLEFDASSAAYVGLRFGVRTFSVALADALGRVVGHADAPAVLGDPRRALQAARRLLDQLLAEQSIPLSRLRGACIAVGGLIDATTGTCVLSTNLGWKDAPLSELSREHLGLPAVVFNVTDAAAIAESRLGAARGAQSFAWIYCGTGIGAGLYAGGQLFRGHSGFAGEIGFCRMAADGPVLEDIASGRALLERALDAPALSKALRARGAEASVGDLLALAEQGVPAAVSLVSEGGAALGLTVAHLVNIVNPELVVLGGGVVERSPLFFDATCRAVASQVLGPELVPVVPTKLSGRAVTQGAVLLAMDAVVQSYRLVRTAR